MAENVDTNTGVIATDRWIVYGRATQGTIDVYEVRDDGRATRVGASVVTALASRGDRVAWGEQTGSVQRVVVFDLATQRRWVAARMQRCVYGQCFRLDAVTLANAGVVFTRGAIGPQPSHIVERPFAGPLRQVTLAGDPQPDLAPSATGAVYNFFGHGWYRWDFTAAKPVRTRFGGNTSVLGYEQGSWYLGVGPVCARRLLVARAGGAPAAVLTAPQAARIGRAPAGDCATLIAVQPTVLGVLTSWAFIPTISINAHTDFGLVGALLRTA